MLITVLKVKRPQETTYKRGRERGIEREITNRIHTIPLFMQVFGRKVSSRDSDDLGLSLNTNISKE